jgi:hypothetical protein
MKNILSLLIIQTMLLHGVCNAQYFGWTRATGGSSDDGALASARDDSGHIYVCGYFKGTVDFDPGAGVNSITSKGQEDIFIEKFSSEGDVLWVKTFGSSGYDKGQSVALDFAGNIYITGTYTGVADFDPGLGTTNLTPVGSSDVFILKLNGAGDLIWVKGVGGSNSDIGFGITVDNTGASYITGSFWYTVDFDPNGGIHNLISAGETDIFVLKLDINGNYVWADRMGGTYTDQGMAIANKAGMIYVTGGYKLVTVDFDPGPGISGLTPRGQVDIFIQKLDSAGDFVWAKSIGGPSIDVGQGIAVDDSGNVYSTGVYKNTADLNPGDDSLFFTATNSEIYVLKQDSNGELMWVKVMDGAGTSDGIAITLDDKGNSYITGDFSNSVDFDPDTGVYLLSSVSGTKDIFVQELNANGNLVWVRSVGSSGTDGGVAVVVDNNNGVYISGSFAGLADFNPDTGLVYSVSSIGSTDLFTWKISPCMAKYLIYPDTVVQHNWFALNQSVGLPPCNYEWFWGDGDSSTGPNPSHTYAVAANYNVCVAITDGQGCENSYCDSSTYIYKTDNLITIHVVDQLTSMIQDVRSENEIALVPNPASNFLMLKNDAEESVEIQIFNISGGVVFHAKGLFNLELDVSSFSRGIYIAEIKTKNYLSRKRWIKI